MEFDVSVNRNNSVRQYIASSTSLVKYFRPIHMMRQLSPLINASVVAAYFSINRAFSPSQSYKMQNRGNPAN